MPWEDPRYGPWPLRFVRSLYFVSVRPRGVFPGPPRSAAALRFAALCGALLGIVGVLGGVAMISVGDTADGAGAAWFRDDPIAKGVASLVLVVSAALLAVAFAGASSISFGAGLASVGRSRGVLRVALRAAGYAQGVSLLAFVLPLSLGTLRTWLGDPEPLATLARVAWMLGGLLFTLGTTRIYFHAGRGLGLRPGRALAASFGPLLLSVPITLVLLDAHLEPLLAGLGVL